MITQWSSHGLNPTPTQLPRALNDLCRDSQKKLVHAQSFNLKNSKSVNWYLQNVQRPLWDTWWLSPFYSCSQCSALAPQTDPIHCPLQPGLAGCIFVLHPARGPDFGGGQILRRRAVGKGSLGQVEQKSASLWKCIRAGVPLQKCCSACFLTGVGLGILCIQLSELHTGFAAAENPITSHTALTHLRPWFIPCLTIKYMSMI